MLFRIYLPDPLYLPFYLFAHSLRHSLLECWNESPSETRVQVVAEWTTPRGEGEEEEVWFIFCIHLRPEMLFPHGRTIVLINSEQHQWYGLPWKRQYLEAIFQQSTSVVKAWLDYNPQNVKHYRA